VDSLRQQAVALSVEEADLSSRFGSRHPQAVALRAERADLEQRIAAEVRRTLQSLRNEVNGAQLREERLDEAITDLETTYLASSEAGIELRRLQREAETDRVLYETFLERYREISLQGDLEQPDARLISAAVVPSVASQPNSMSIFLLSLIGGTLIGGVLALLAEHLDRTVRTARQAEQLTGLPVAGMLPRLAWWSRRQQLVRPREGMARALRTVHLALTNLRRSQGPLGVLMITSVTRREGKSTFSLALARTLAGDGIRVLLIDADAQKPRLARTIAQTQTPSTGSDGKDGGEAKSDADMPGLRIDPISGFRYVVADRGGAGAPLHIGDRDFDAVVSEAKQRFDLVIIDAPSIDAGLEAVFVGHAADARLLLVRWGATSRSAVVSALNRFSAHDVTMSAVVLTAVDQSRHEQYAKDERVYHAWAS
jgi:Mrp family chromosome partitioning ATPase